MINPIHTFYHCLMCKYIIHRVNFHFENDKIQYFVFIILKFKNFFVYTCMWHAFECSKVCRHGVCVCKAA